MKPIETIKIGEDKARKYNYKLYYTIKDTHCKEFMSLGNDVGVVEELILKDSHVIVVSNTTINRKIPIEYVRSIVFEK